MNSSRDERCRNLNHGRTNVPIRFCPDCGEQVSSNSSLKSCNETTHAARRKDRSLFCCDCGKKLR